MVVTVGEFTGRQVTVSVRVEVPVIADKAARDGNDAAAGDAGGARDGSANGGGTGLRWTFPLTHGDIDRDTLPSILPLSILP